jgi:hypothetical protein
MSPSSIVATAKAELADDDHPSSWLGPRNRAVDRPATAPDVYFSPMDPRTSAPIAEAYLPP